MRIEHLFLWGLIWGLSLAVRFWGLNRLDPLVFDEVYYAKFAQDYLTGTPFFDAHPPLGKYLIALGIRLGGFNPIGYRWLNALVGSLVPLVAGALAHVLSGRPRLALLTGCLVALDGLLLVESRYALINLYLVFFGLLGQVLWLTGRRAEHPLGWQLLGGIALGASVSVKWNGLGYLVGLAIYGLARRLPTPAGREPVSWDGRWWHWARHGLCLGVMPAATYLLLWQPHLRQNPGATLLTLHQQILGYHQNLGATVHPYCSPWWSWPLMLRPVSYFYAKVGPAGQELIGNVQGMGNPVLWGWVAGAVLLGLGYGVRWARATPEEREPLPAPLLFGLLNVAANWLPWALARRCLFIYHYLPALIAGCLVLAWWLDEAWKSPAGRLLAGMLLGLIGLGFYFWLPIYLGLPLTPAEWQRRFPFSGWI